MTTETKTIRIGRYTFEGPYYTTGMLEDRAGVYAIHCERDGKYYLIDVGESATVKSRVESHDRKTCWSRNCGETITYAAYYTPNTQQPGRRAIEQEIRNQFKPPCGEQ